MGDRLFHPVRGDEHDVDFNDTTAFAVKRWEDAVISISQMQTSADREKILEPREWQSLHMEIQRISKAPDALPITKKLLNHMQPLPRTVNNLVGYFIRAINPVETDLSVLWGLLHLNLTLSCVSTDKLTKTAGWSKKLRSVIELFNRCLEACDDMNEARLAMVDILEYTLQIVGESVRYLRRCPTDAEANKGWKCLEARIAESLSEMEITVRHLNDITSYSMVNIGRQVKSLGLRHAAGAVPAEYSRFPTFMVPKNQNMNFYGREDELKRIDHYLDPRGSNLLRTYTIYGRRGVGKTDIALQYAYTNPSHFDAIFWIGCETSITLRQSFTDMAVALNLPGADRNGHHEENQLSVQKWLKSTKRTWLLIFDNAERESIMRGYWPVGANGAILTTSRKYYNFTFDAQRKGETVKVFKEAQSWDLLMKFLGPEWQERDRLGKMKSLEERAAKELLNSIGGVALAIQQAAELIKSPEIGGTTILSTYVSFKDHRDQLPDRHSGHRSELMKSLDTLWSMTFKHLTRNARDMLGVLSLLSPDGIPVDLFLPRNQKALDGKLSFCKQHSDDVDATSQATLSSVIRPPQHLQTAMDELLRFKLIKREGRDIWAHRVVQEAMNYHSFTELQDYFHSASALVYEAFPKQTNGDYLTRDQSAACVSYISHAANLSLQFSKYHRAEGAKALKGSDEFIKLLHNAAWYLYELSDYETCLSMVETAWLACEDKNSLQYAALYNVAGCASSELNRLGDCRKYWTMASEIQDSCLAEDDILRSASYHNMGVLESASGNLDEAIALFTKTISIRLKAGDAAASLLANSYLCLSRAYFLRQESEKAFNLLGESEALFLRVAGPDSHFMASVHYAYGNIDFAQSRWTGAKRCYETCLRIGLATTAIHPITAAAYYSLGCVEFELKNHDKAKGYLDKALAIAQLRSPSRDDGTVARILWKTSVVLEDDVVGVYQKEASEMRLRAELALRNLVWNGEGGLVMTVDEEGNADGVETEDVYDSLVPGFFR